MRKRHHDEIDRLAKEVMAIIDEMHPSTGVWLKAFNKLRRIRLEAMGVHVPERPETVPAADVERARAKRPSQNDMILEYLKLGHPLTSLEALRHFDCFRLASRISDLRRKGWPIDREMFDDPRTGKSYAVYSMRKDNTTTNKTNEIC